MTNRMVRRMAASVVLAALADAPSWGLVSTNVPLDHWSYHAVEKLADYGLIESSLLTVKPVSRVEMARHIAQAMYALEDRVRDHPQSTLPALVEAILERLKREFRDELVRTGVLDGWSAESALKPVEDPYVKYLYAEDRPDLENVRGDEFQQGSNYRGGFASRAILLDRAAFYLHPEYIDSPEIERGVELIEGYGKVMVGQFEVEAGRDSLWWGPGHHGSMLMSNNAQPLTLVKLTNPQPLQLPWVFRHLGLVKGEWFLAKLEEDRAIPEARLSGIRLNLKPHPALELGASRVAMFGGRGVPRVDFFDYVKMFLAGSEQQENNQLAGLDASLLVPLGEGLPLRSIRIYADLAGEDEADGYPSKWGELLGLRLNDLLKTGRTDLRVEYANNHVSGNPNVFYEHSLYTSGYTYEDRVLGHHMGTDSQDVFLQLSHYLTPEAVVELAYDRQTHDLSGDRRPHEDIFECNVTLFPAPDWRIRTGYRYETRADRRDDENHILHLELIRRF